MMNPEDAHVSVSQRAINDTNLSAKARGLLVWMVAQGAADISIRKMSKSGLGGPDAIRSGLDELEKRGYLVRRRIRDENDKLLATEYLVTDTPQNRRAA